MLKTTKSIEKKSEVLQSKRLRTLKVSWSNMISKSQLYIKASVKPIRKSIEGRRWKGLGRACCYKSNSVVRIHSQWILQGQRRRGKPNETWRRTITKNLKSRGLTTEQMFMDAFSVRRWNDLTVELGVTKHKENRMNEWFNPIGFLLSSR